MTTLILLNGRNVANIADEAVAALNTSNALVHEAITETYVVTRSNDTMTIPTDLKGPYTVVKSDDFVVDAEKSYILIANGGTTEQLLSVLQAFRDANESVEVYDLQRDKCSLYTL